MSQTLWRKAREPNGVFDESSSSNSSPANNSSSTLNGSNPELPFNRTTVPPNGNGKRYAMNEVFQVWFDNKESILNHVNSTPTAAENYKLAHPGPIYHLELQLATSPETDVASKGNGQPGLDSNNEKKTSDVSGSAASVPLTGLNQPQGGPPPGMSPAHLQSNNDHQQSQVQFLTPDKIEWIYVDPSGKEQGPFNGDMMQEWLTDGYLNLDLRIRRKEEFKFQTLKDICESVQNYTHPFKVPLPSLPLDSSANVQQPIIPQNVSASADTTGSAAAPIQSQIHHFLSGGADSSLNLGAGGMRLTNPINQQNLFANDFISHNDPFAASNQAAPFQNGPSTNQFGIDSLNFNQPLPMNHHMTSILQQQIHHQQPVLSRSNSGWGIDNSGLLGSTPATPTAVPTVLQSSIGQPAPMSPWLSGVPHSRVSSPFIPTTSLSDTNGNGSKESAHDNVLNSKPETNPVDIVSAPSEPEKVQPATPSKPVETKPEPESKPEKTEKQVEQKEEKVEAPVKPVADKPKKVLIPLDTSATQAAKSAAGNTDSPGPAKTTLAPWAQKEVSATAPKLTLKEIQELEAEELKKQKKIQQELNEQAAKAAAQAWKEEQSANEKQTPSLPKTSGWASVPSISAVTTKKTLADIQKEEAEAAAARAAKLSAASAAPPLASNLTTAKSISFANAVANSTPKDDNNWTVVPKKATTIAKKVVKANPIVNNTTSKVDPQVLRSVSAARPTTSVNSGAIREEFVIWARSAMTNLYPSVSKDDLLDIFLTLPANSPDSSSLISETIYSSSPTLDGRRFAKEFLDKRAKVEQQVGQTNDWSSAIISSADKVPAVDENGWSTGKKKKGRR